MTEQNVNIRKNIRRNSFYAVLIVLLGVALNLGGSALSGVLNLPIYLDSIGTVFVGAIGGYLPGVVVGFVSNIINGLIDATNAYYAVISVMLGVCATYFAERGYFKSLKKALLVLFPLAIIGGAFGYFITFCINGFGSQQSGVFGFFPNAGLFMSELAQNLGYDIIDKAITVLAAYILVKYMPEEVKEKLRFVGWKQNPLTSEDQKKAEMTHPSQSSLRSKIMLIIGASTIALALITSVISFMLYRDATIREHTTMGVGTSKLVATVVDGNKINDYLKLGEDAPGYREVKAELEEIRGTSDEIAYVYVYKILEDGCHVVFDLDTEDTPGGKPGEIVEFDQGFKDDIPLLLAGKEIAPIETNETFGWLLTMYEPIRDAQGVTQAYACVDISLEEVRVNEWIFIAKVFSLFFACFVFIISIGLWLAEYSLILPINSMAIAADHFAYNSESAREDSVEKFKNLKIRTGDEIENLYDTFSMTIEETVQYIADMQRQAEVINRMQNGLIFVLADMVESRDQCTGDHVRKTAAYCEIILEQLRKDGEYSDQLNDSFIRDVVNSAPLHDVGKIKVSDVILNKPGKLTDEEFEEMKKHTIAGSEIIQQAIELVASDAGYLEEAKNLAKYHHEKWNGKGYPTGLSGEEIPLSARVMAVADVFDALVSQRSYKKPFTFDKAISIIEEGSGSHFDPLVVKAFLEVKDRAREISEANLSHTGMIQSIREDGSITGTNK